MQVPYLANKVFNQGEEDENMGSDTREEQLTATVTNIKETKD